jgi:hypothetical protein
LSPAIEAMAISRPQPALIWRKPSRKVRKVPVSAELSAAPALAMTISTGARGLEHRLDARLLGHVGHDHADRIVAAGHLFQRLAPPAGDDDLGARLAEAAAEIGADAGAAAGDQYSLALQTHARIASCARGRPAANA